MVVLDIARAELGYTEKPTNRTKYGQAYGMDGVSWCAIFTWWCRQQAGVPYPVKTPSCAILLSALRSRGLTIDHPLPGGTFFCGLQGADHTGLIETVKPDGKTFTTIEGNASPSGSYNGTQVCRRTRRVADGRVYGVFGIPPASTGSTSAPAPKEDNDMPAYADRCQWNDGSVAIVYPDGAVFCYGAKSFGTMLDLDPKYRSTFEQARSIRPVDPANSQAGYRVGDKTEWSFDENVKQYFKKK